MAENFFSILKTECIYRQKIATIQEAQNLIDEFIHFYNYERIQPEHGRSTEVSSVRKVRCHRHLQKFVYIYSIKFAFCVVLCYTYENS